MVIAVRRSGASFTSPYNVRSEAFDAYLQERDASMKRVGQLQEELGAELYAQVPLQQDGNARAVLLRAKRKIWNGRPVAEADLLLINGHLRDLVCQYNAELEAMALALSSRRALIVTEFRSALLGLVRQPRFRLAVNYACPWLIDTFERHPPSPDDDFSNEERGLFSYGVKFFSKANPLHLFATMSLLQEEEACPKEFCEVIVDTSFALQLEQAALSAVIDPHRRYVYLRTYLDEGQVWRFLTRSREKWRVVSVKHNPKLSRIASLLSNSSVPCSLGECEDALLALSEGAGREEIQKYIASLLRHNILVEYLISDFRRFADQLKGSNPALDESLAFFAGIHLKPIQETNLAAIQTAVKTIKIPGLGTPTYYVNSYSNDFKKPPEHLLSQVATDLRALKGFLTALPNTTKRADRLTTLLRDRLANYPLSRAPYLAVLHECLRNWNADSVDLGPQSQPGSSREAAEDWAECLGALEGIITESDLDQLRPHGLGIHLPGICCNGPIDPHAARFFPTNIFSGDSRFLSRYLLCKSGHSYRQPSASHPEEDLHVQLVAPFTDNRLFVRSLYPVGCGFESRYRYQFEQWIDPSEIFLELHDGRIRYRHIPSQKLMHIHYIGFLLSEFLTMEYSLLLLDHVDNYANPFSIRPKIHEMSTALGAISRVPELIYGAICLRREEFRIPATTIQKALDGKDFLEGSATLRDSLHLLAGNPAEHWYVLSPRASKGGLKPRFLDLRNPLSAQLLKREIASLQHNAQLSFSPMDPPVEHLLSEQNEQFTSEYMIEV